MRPAIESFRRIRHKGLADRFYEKFLARDPEVADMFANTDFTRQKDLLLHGIQMLLDTADGKAMGAMAMTRMASFHARVGVTKRMYDAWIECLLEVVTEIDADVDDALLTDWRAAVEKGVAFMWERQSALES